MTTRQEKFVEFYSACGNASEAARKAGYKTKSNVIGAELLANPSIKAKIREKNKNNSKATIASGKELKEFWTKMLQDKKEDPKNRLKASELLGKTKGLFLDRVQMSTTSKLVEVPPMVPEPVDDD